MSKIQAELAAATECEPSKRKEETITTPAYMARLATAVGDLGDADWEKLSKEAQDWYNEAVDATEAGKDIPVYADARPAPAASTGRRGSAKKEDAAAPYKPAKGDKVNVTTKRGREYTGEVVEADEVGVVIDVDGKDVELEHGNIATIALAAGAAKDEPPADPEGPADPAVGDTVQVETARGKIITGNVTELTDDDIVLTDAAGEIHELLREKLKSLVVKVPAKKPAAAAKTASNTPAAGDKPKRVTAASNGGVSATQRMRELIAANLDAKKEDIAAGLKKDGLEFKQATLDLIYSDSHKLIGCLRALKKIK